MLFNIARLKTHSKTREICIRELLYADDSALVATEQGALQEIVDRFSATANFLLIEFLLIENQHFQNRAASPASPT